MQSPLPPTREEEVYIDPACLRPGLFVRLNLGWVSHPFLFNQFRISSEAQVRQIQALGLPRIAYLPGRSIAAPLPAPPAATAAADPASAPATAPVTDDQTVPTPPVALDTHEDNEKSQQAERIAEQRARINRCERRYTEAAGQIRSVMHSLFGAAEKSVATARALIGGIVDGFADSGELVIHLMNEKIADETAYFHVLNVMILSLLLGRELKLPPEVLRLLGEGALFHDIGKSRIPDAVLRNNARNRHEEEFFRLHTTYGREIARELGHIAPAACDAIEFHHETMDGKGYPRGLAGTDIPVLARVVAIANRYDNLCNPIFANTAMTPAEALTHMFRNEANAWDKAMLQHFIRLLGVYPPGSLAQLSNGNVALVVAVDHADLLRPSVMIYDPSIPKSEALVIDLSEEPEVQIDLVLKPRDLERPVLDYLAPRRRMSYFHGTRQQ